MAVEVFAVFRVLVEMVGREHRRQHGNAGLQLQGHQRVHHRSGDELVAVDTAVHHQGAAHHGGVTPGERQPFGVQGDLKGTGHVEHIDAVAGHTQALHLFEKGVAGLVDDVRMPLGLDKSKPLLVGRRDGVEGKVVDLTHGVSNKELPESGRTNTTTGARPHRRPPGMAIALSFIRTLGTCALPWRGTTYVPTVGFGIAPKSADPAAPCGPQALAGLCGLPHHHRRWGITPRPENACGG